MKHYKELIGEHKRKKRTIKPENSIPYNQSINHSIVLIKVCPQGKRLKNLPWTDVGQRKKKRKSKISNKIRIKEWCFFQPYQWWSILTIHLHKPRQRIRSTEHRQREIILRFPRKNGRRTPFAYGTVMSSIRLDGFTFFAVPQICKCKTVEVYNITDWLLAWLPYREIPYRHWNLVYTQAGPFLNSPVSVLWSRDPVRP